MNLHSVKHPFFRLLILCHSISLVLLISSAFAYAETDSPRAVAAAVADEINSPFCPGRLLRDCPSGAATDLKFAIEELAKKGLSKSEIIDELVKRYGDSINPLPSFQGIGAFAWIGPILFIILGGALLGIKVLRSLQREEHR